MKNKPILVVVAGIVIYCILMNLYRLISVQLRTNRQKGKYIKGLTDWMTNLPTDIKKRRLNELNVVGTHDSQAYQFIDHGLNRKISSTNLTWKHANTTQKYIGIGKEFIADWTFTQNKNIENQLVYGIRAFDIRSTYSSGRFLFSHSLACVYAEDLFQQFKDFLNKYPNEIVFINSKPDSEHAVDFTDEIEVKYIELMKKYLGDKLIPVGKIPSLEECQKNGKQVVFAMSQNTGSDPLIWDLGSFAYQWNQTNDIKELYAFNQNQVENASDTDKVFYTVGLNMSPNSDTVKKNIKPYLLNIFVPFGYYIWPNVASIRTISQPVQAQWYMFPIHNRKKVCIWWTDFPSDQLIHDIIESNLT